MVCHHCGSTAARKNGTYQGVQRYICKGCGRTFTDRGERFSKEIKEKALQMYLNNVGIRKIALFLGASPAGVLKWIRTFGPAWAARLRAQATQIETHLPDTIELDEIYTFVKKNNAGSSFGLLILGQRAIFLRIPSAKA